jgi:hypothetical protein
MSNPIIDDLDEQLRNAPEEVRDAMELACMGLALSPGAILIAVERLRQIDPNEERGGEGWSFEHDDEHRGGELAYAAASYAASTVNGQVARDKGGNDLWPWAPEWDKRPAPGASREERIRALEKAGALIAAEIDRLYRERRYQAQAAKDAGADEEPLPEVTS